MKSVLAIASTLLMSQIALGAETSVEEKPSWQLTWFSDLSGPQVTSPLDGKTAQPDGNPGSPVYIYNSPSVRYQLSENAQVRVHPRFVWNATSGVEVIDPRVNVNFSNVVNAGPYNLAIRPEVELPFSERSQDQNKAFAFRLRAYNSFSITDSLSGTVLLAPKFNFFAGSSKGAEQGADIQMIVSPWLEYSLSDKVSLMLYNEIGINYDRQAFPNNSTNTVFSQFYVNYTPIERLTLSPYLKVFPGSLAFDSTTIGIEVSGSLFLN